MDFKYKSVFKYQGKTLSGTPYFNEKNEKNAKRKRRRTRDGDTSRREKGNKTKRDVTNEEIVDHDVTTTNVDSVTDRVAKDRSLDEHPTHGEKRDISKSGDETSETNVQERETSRTEDTKTLVDTSVSTVSFDTKQSARRRKLRRYIVFIGAIRCIPSVNRPHTIPLFRYFM